MGYVLFAALFLLGFAALIFIPLRSARSRHGKRPYRADMTDGGAPYIDVGGSDTTQPGWDHAAHGVGSTHGSQSHAGGWDSGGGHSGGGGDGGGGGGDGGGGGH